MKDHMVSQGRSLVDKSEGELIVVQQCELLGIHRSGVYYKAVNFLLLFCITNVFF